MIVDKLGKGGSVEVKCTAQPDDNNCNGGWSLKSVLKMMFTFGNSFLSGEDELLLTNKDAVWVFYY